MVDSHSSTLRHPIISTAGLEINVITAGAVPAVAPTGVVVAFISV